MPEHIAFLSRETPNIEGLSNLESLVGDEEIVFVGFPLKIQDGNGAPMRAAAPSVLTPLDRVPGLRS